jgi:hypothetical protein
LLVRLLEKAMADIVSMDEMRDLARAQAEAYAFLVSEILKVDAEHGPELGSAAILSFYDKAHAVGGGDLVASIKASIASTDEVLKQLREAQESRMEREARDARWIWSVSADFLGGQSADKGESDPDSLGGVSSAQQACVGEVGLGKGRSIALGQLVRCDVGAPLPTAFPYWGEASGEPVGVRAHASGADEAGGPALRLRPLDAHRGAEISETCGYSPDFRRIVYVVDEVVTGETLPFVVHHIGGAHGFWPPVRMKNGIRIIIKKTKVYLLGLITRFCSLRQYFREF